MSALRFILGDQLSRSLSSLADIDAAADTVLMVEVVEEATYVPHHKQKLVLVLAAMRHFAETLREEGIRVDYVRLDDAENTGSFSGELARAVQRHSCDRVVVTEPGEWRVRQMMEDWRQSLAVPLEVREDDRFLCSLGEFEQWAEGRKSLRMEYFYRSMRRKTGWLMDGDQPLGGRWNYDADNRKALPAGTALPARWRPEPDPLTRQVMDLVESRFGDHFGELEPFGWAVRRGDALKAMEQFITDCLPRFGDYQDAMKSDENFLFHALLSPYLNLGLLEAREVCEAALAAHDQGQAPLAAVEGFVRQVLGWREYVRGLYWLRMPDYANSNFLNAHRPLPDFFWTAETDLSCLREALQSTRRHAYAHHIQRLMVIGNFALLTGLAPAAVEEWYLMVYADAYEWVELPNTHGMALFADGGVMASKPYAASGAYINRMSNYCSGCRYDPKLKMGEGACPFNYLYWYFLHRNEAVLRKNPRMALALRNLDRMPVDRLRGTIDCAEEFLASAACKGKGN
jgi:deoxyribodipyrimidine photolyase-related protein